MLTGGPRDAPQRQQTLKATIDWSYELLDQREQTLLARLAVFAGGCTLAAAQVISGAQLDTLQALVDRSLVRTDGERYWMLQTIREYALEKLEQTGQAETVRGVHAQWLVDLLDAEGIAVGWPAEASLNRLRPERENFRVALEWASRTGSVDTLAWLASGYSAVWVFDAQLHEAERWIAVALRRQDEYSGRLAAQVISAAWRLARHQGNTSGATMLTKRALELWQDIGEPKAIGRAMVDVAQATAFDGDLRQGRRALEQAIDFARQNALSDVLHALNNLADLAILEGDLGEGRALSQESLAVSAPGSARADVALLNLVHIESLQGNALDALRIGSQALDAALRRGDLVFVSWAAIGLAWPLAEQGQLERAGQLLGAALAFLDATGTRIQWMDEAGERAVREILSERLGAHAGHALIDEGRHVPLERAARAALDAIETTPALAALALTQRPHHPAPSPQCRP